MEFGLETVGVLFLLGGPVMICYTFCFWLLSRRLSSTRLDKLLRLEVWLALGVVGLLSLIGAIDAYDEQILVTVLFAEIWVITLVFASTNYLRNQRSEGTDQAAAYVHPKWLYWLFGIGNGLVLILFNDYFEEDILFLATAAMYFPALLFLAIRWVLAQVAANITLKREVKTTELLHLQGQVNPHFFFNMLNNLYGWVEKDPGTAKEMILSLSDLMRYGIYDGQKEEVTLAEEVAYLENYVALHRSRYHKKIDVSFRVEISGEEKIMPLLLIILLENAFKHGVENLREDAYIKVDLYTEEGYIHFRVANNFDHSIVPGDTGIGLKNLRRRLELGYPERHALDISQEEDLFIAQLSLACK